MEIIEMPIHQTTNPQQTSPPALYEEPIPEPPDGHIDYSLNVNELPHPTAQLYVEPNEGNLPNNDELDKVGAFHDSFRFFALELIFNTLNSILKSNSGDMRMDNIFALIKNVFEIRSMYLFLFNLQGAKMDINEIGRSSQGIKLFDDGYADPDIVLGE